MSATLPKVVEVSEIRYGWNPALIPSFAILLWRGPGWYARAVHRNRFHKTYYFLIEWVGEDSRARAEERAAKQLLEPASVIWAQTPEEALAPYRSLEVDEPE